MFKGEKLIGRAESAEAEVDLEKGAEYEASKEKLLELQGDVNKFTADSGFDEMSGTYLAIAEQAKAFKRLERELGELSADLPPDFQDLMNEAIAFEGDLAEYAINKAIEGGNLSALELQAARQRYESIQPESVRMASYNLGSAVEDFSGLTDFELIDEPAEPQGEESRGFIDKSKEFVDGQMRNVVKLMDTAEKEIQDLAMKGVMAIWEKIKDGTVKDKVMRFGGKVIDLTTETIKKHGPSLVKGFKKLDKKFTEAMRPYDPSVKDVAKSLYGVGKKACDAALDVLEKHGPSKEQVIDIAKNVTKETLSMLKTAGVESFNMLYKAGVKSFESIASVVKETIGEKVKAKMKKPTMNAG